MSNEKSLDERLIELMGEDLEDISPQMALRLGYLQLREEQALPEAEDDKQQAQIELDDLKDLHERDIFKKGYENNQKE